MLVFIDETGDHSLEKIDATYPLFGLGALIITEHDYEKLGAEIEKVKRDFFADDGTFILHSSELKRPNKKRTDSRNVIMNDVDMRRRFYAILDAILLKIPFQIALCFVDKIELKSQYHYPADPYYFSFENILNRILTHGGTHNDITAEQRGAELNIELEAEYERFCKVGVRFHRSEIVAERTSLRICQKSTNSVGLQMIDLILAALTRDFLGKTEKMVGNDLTPALLKQKYACPPTIFPLRSKKSPS